MENSYTLLLKKLDEFIRKYYTNQMIRGAILFVSLGIVLFLTVITIEYFGQFNSLVRTVLFYSFTTLMALVFIILIVIPGLKFFSIGKRISHENASKIIGKHFSTINDKLSNLLQLKDHESGASSDLVIASINQKIGELKPVPFGLAINFGENKKYLKYLVIPVLIISCLAAFKPKIITDSTNRLVEHQKDFIPLAPYQIQLNNNSLTAYKNEDFTISVFLSGEEIPNNLNVIFSKQRFLMKKQAKNSFEYTFKNIQGDLVFTLFDGEFESKKYQIKTLQKPILAGFSIDLVYPSYLNKQTIRIDNTGDLVIPEGTSVKWVFKTKDTEQLTFIDEDSTLELTRSGENEFLYSKRFYESSTYALTTANKFLNNVDTVSYALEIIKDLRPSIELDTQDDSLNPSMRYFKGYVKDDYGFSKLVFHAQYISANDSVGQEVTRLIPINQQLPNSDFFHSLNIENFSLNAGDRVEYYFEIWDNDGVNGSKSARTQKNSLKAPSIDELSKKNKENEKFVEQELKENIKLTQEIKKELDALNEKLLNKKELGFQEKKQLQSLLDKQKKVQQSIKKLNDKNKKNNRLREQFSPQDQALLEKQKQLEEMFEKLMSEEMKEMMKEIEKMMDKLKKDDLQKALEKIELSNEELEKELDRNLELFKQLELEKQLAEAKEKLDKIKEEQTKLKDETKEKKSDSKELEKKQQKLNEEFKKLGEKLDDIEQKNQELEEPNKMEETQSLEDQIKKDMKESADELSKNEKQEASESQEDSEKKMEELSDQLSQMQQQMQSQNNAENLEDLRALLENLIHLSFDQESVMQQLKKTNRNDPKYISLAQQQKKLKDDSKIIEDSLFALSKRVQQLSGEINKEMTAVNFNMEKAIDELGERRTPTANSRQQFAMTSLNNLALLLDAAVQNMQQQMQQGKGECKKPGGGKPKPGSMKKLQQQLNKQMEGLKKAMKEGKKPGNKPGKKGQGGMSKELAQMAAKQAAIRKSLQEMREQIGEGNGKESGNLKKLGELMEKTETDLVNKQITNETLLRQQEILSRLLESEKAEREREKEEKRESIEFSEEISRNPNSFLEYNRLKEKEIELLKTLPPSFKNFYKFKVSEYFNQLGK